MNAPLHCFILAIGCFIFGANHADAMAPKMNGNKAIDHAVIHYGMRTEPELKSYFRTANVNYPPKQVAFLAFKKESHI